MIRLAGALAAVAALTLTGCAPEAAEPVASTPGRTVYVDAGGNRLVILGERCLAAEDSTRLRLVSYAPSRSTIVYRCVAP